MRDEREDGMDGLGVLGSRRMGWDQQLEMPFYFKIAQSKIAQLTLKKF